MKKNASPSTLKDLVKLSEWIEVKRAFKFHYPELKHLDLYEGLFYRIRTVKGKGTDGFLKVELVDSDEQYYSVVLSVEEKGVVMDFAIGLSSHSMIANTPISEDVLKTYRREEIIAHILWEMTYYGIDDKEIGKLKKSLAQSIKDIKG